MMRMAIPSAVVSMLLASASLAQVPDAQKKAAGENEKVLRAAREAVAKQQEKNAAKEKGATLEDLIAQALKNNPDIRVAESKVHEAEAELYRTRLLVSQKVAALHNIILGAKAIAEEAAMKLKSAEELSKRGASSAEDFRMAKLTRDKMMFDLASREAELPYLLGTGSPSALTRNMSFLHYLDPNTGTIAKKSMKERAVARDEAEFLATEDLQVQAEIQRLIGARNNQPATSKLSPTMADNIRKSLDTMTPADLNFTDKSVKDILEHLQTYTKGLNLVEQVGDKTSGTVSAHFKEPVPVGAVFQFIEDAVPRWSFVVRDYGIVLTNRSSVPPGAVYLLDLWRNRPTQTENKSVPTTDPNRR